MTDGLWGALYGAIATCAVGFIAALIAWRLGKLQIGLGRLQLGVMQKAHDFSVAKASAEVGCDVNAQDRQILPAIYNPHIFLNVKLYNEGELVARNLRGRWKFIPPDPVEKRVFDFHQDALGKGNPYLDTYKIEQSSNWNRKGIRFDVEIEFFYSVLGEKEDRRYSAKYYYHAESSKMVRKSYE